MKTDPFSSTGSVFAGESFQRLVLEFSRLPGIGEKTANRLAYHLIRQDKHVSESLAQAILNARVQTQTCSVCFGLSETPICSICSSPQRDRRKICVLEKPSDISQIEQSGIFHGMYHVLHGVLSPLDGIGPEDLKVRELLERLRPVPEQSPSEIILAFNPTVEGDATSLYLHRLLKPLELKVTQLAHGIPVGGALEFTDRQTIGKAFENRAEILG